MSQAINSVLNEFLLDLLVSLALQQSSHSGAGFGGVDLVEERCQMCRDFAVARPQVQQRVADPPLLLAHQFKELGLGHDEH